MMMINKQAEVRRLQIYQVSKEIKQNTKTVKYTFDNFKYFQMFIFCEAVNAFYIV